MSRIGNKEILIPAGVKASLTGRTLQIEGVKGKLALNLQEDKISCSLEAQTIAFSRKVNNKRVRALHGLYRSLTNNMVLGVSKGFRKDLAIEGIGFKAQVKGKGLVFDLGFSHQVELVPPAGVSVKINSPTSLSVEGIDKQLVGQTAADIRAMKKPEPYKGKGIRYVDERVRRKQGKKVG